MTLNKWDPIKDLLNMQEKLHRIMHTGSAESCLPRAGYWCPAVDILETQETYIFRVELPGVGKENINVEVSNSALIISGRRPSDKDPEVANYHRIERNQGFFQRSFTLPGYVDVENSAAKYVDGILEVILPKAERGIERSIQVVCLV
jgi:HSP20 family protein